MATLIAVAVNQAGAQDPAIIWQADIATAQQIARQTNKLVLVHFWAPSCGPCMKLEHEVFTRPETVQAMNANFICVKVNTDATPEVAQAYSVTMLPTDVVLTTDGRLIAHLQCPQAANQYIQQVCRVADGYRQLASTATNAAQTAAHTAAQTAAMQAQQLGTQTQQAAAGYAAQYQAAQHQAATAPGGAAMPPAQSTPPAYGVAAGAGLSSSQGAPVGAYSDDRYANYLRDRQGEAQQAVAGALNDAGNAAAAAGNAAADYAARYAPPAGPGATGAPPAMQPSSYPGQAEMPSVAGGPLGGAPVSGVPAEQQAPQAYFPPQVPAYAEQRQVKDAAHSPVAQQASAIQLPPGSPPLALEGYCTVQLREHKRWVVGDRRWGAVHRGRTYLFTGPEEQKKFLEAPDAYAPVISGNDPVLALDNGQAVPGRREHGVFYENRIYLFADEASLQRFYQNPNRYAAEIIQAMR